MLALFLAAALTGAAGPDSSPEHSPQTQIGALACQTAPVTDPTCIQKSIQSINPATNTVTYLITVTNLTGNLALIDCPGACPAGGGSLATNLMLNPASATIVSGAFAPSAPCQFLEITPISTAAAG